MPDSPAATVRRAANLLRERAEAAIEDGWVRPTVLVDAHEPLVFAGGDVALTGDPSLMAPAERFPRAEEWICTPKGPSFATHIAAADPAVMLEVAESWNRQADDMDDVARIKKADRFPRTPYPVIVTASNEVRLDWTATWRAARLYLREER